MVCMTVLVMACAMGYAAWEGRYRGRPYFALLLLLESALILVFCARDLILFYVGFEAMLIPLYFLIGIWGGPERRKGTLKFLIYTFVGTLLMLVGMIVIGLRGRLVRPDRDRHVELELGVRGVHPRVRDQGAGVAAARLAARRVPQRAARGGGRALGRGVEGGCVRLPADRAADLPRARRRVPVAAGRGGGDRAAVRLVDRVPSARRPRRHRLLVDRADGPRHPRHLRPQRPGCHRRGVPDGQPRPAVRGVVPARRLGRAHHRPGRVRPPRRPRARSTGARDRRHHHRRRGAGRARLERVRLRVPGAAGRLRGEGRGRGDRVARGDPRGHVHAAVDLGDPARPRGRRRRRVQPARAARRRVLRRDPAGGGGAGAVVLPARGHEAGRRGRRRSSPCRPPTEAAK